MTLLFLRSDLRVAGELPSMDDKLKLRKSLHLMRMLMQLFIPCIVGKMMENADSCWKEGVNKIATVSDEVFVLLVLEDIWNNMIMVNIDEYYQPKKEKRKVMMRSIKNQLVPLI